MQAIRTHYLSPTNYSGARIKATCDAAAVTVGWDHALDVPENHRVAAATLMGKLEWTGEFVSGCLPDGSYAHVFTGK